ncbi:GNAT family N-acetyltransferase [Streptomyces boninensis]|uniref:GNAT family N-acetyltransferase n=1 Tax=Streptomyces boninensis TaxID=2039455 RepID=UPI003B21C36E
MTDAGTDAVVLTAGRVTLRELAATQLAQVADGGSGGLVWIDGAPPEGTRTGAGIMAKAVLLGTYRRGWGSYAITRTADGVALGGMGFHAAPDRDGVVEIGYDLSVSARGSGWATDAARALCGWAMGQPGVRVLRAKTVPGNDASQRVLVRAGFRQVGVEREEEEEWHVYELPAATVPSSG